MRNHSQKSGDSGSVVPRGRVNNGILPNSFRAFSSYLKIVSSGASTVASTVRSAASAASAIVERDGDTSHDQISWAGFDKLELEKGNSRQVLLLGFSYGFQIWDVEAADNVRNIVSRHDGPVSFMQVLPKPLASNEPADKFADSRPLLVICADGSFSGDINVPEGSALSNGMVQHSNGSVNGTCMPTVVWFYSFKSQSYVHLLRFRSVVHLVRCSSRVVAVLQSNQIHCLNASSLEREYTILTNPVPSGTGNIGVGPLAVGPRWMAYSGSQVAISTARRVSPQHVSPSPNVPSHSLNGSLVGHLARESSKQLAAGIATLGDMGYKKLSRYYSDLYPEANNFQSGSGRLKVNGVANGHSPDAHNVGMVVVRDIVSKDVIAQFKAHKSPILSLCFDPSGVLLVTASVQGHNINVFRIMPDSSGAASHVHLYRLQRGLTNAVIQDISFSSDSQWIMISSLRGTSHLFAISVSGGLVNFQSSDSHSSARNRGSSLMTKPAVHGSPNSGLLVLTQQSVCASGPPVNLNAVSRIRNGSNGWRNTVNGAAAVATGRSSSLSGAVASVFHNCKGAGMHGDQSSLMKNYHLLVFSPSGSVIQYVLHCSPALDGVMALPGASLTCESGIDYDARLMVEAMQKWNICQKQNRKERGDNVDIYGENGNSDSSKVYPEIMRHENGTFSDVSGLTINENIVSEEKHHMYISEAELQMHQKQNLVWTRSEQIYFQSMQNDDLNEGDHGGEIEIERFPVRMLEARSKDLVPIIDYLQNPKFQRERVSTTGAVTNGHFQPQGSTSSENGKIRGRRLMDSLDGMANCGIVGGNEPDNGLDANGQDGLQTLTETSRGYVNNNDTTTTNTEQEETVYTRAKTAQESQLRSVNNRDGSNMKNQFEEGDEFD
ncbi:autophagy-related protein 18f-like isoform X1 [Salvia splendens]|uniref:autophagy-related protein 18f-like isoform X1 n=1 Tax=Salvia splendens TaxID=180675 RepID=UPI001C254188|nr:autophagy-related protein 18f-like isoform X1 [Salvia splendens]